LAVAPYWSYGDLGVFLLALAVLRLGLQLLARLQLLASNQLAHPSDGLQSAVVLYLTVSLYAVLRLHYRRPVLIPLGWVRPTFTQISASLGTGVTLGVLVALYQHFRLQGVAFTTSVQLIWLAVLLAPVLEESLFRGCLFPLIANSAGDAVAMILSAAAFALFHGPTDLTHWVSLLLTGVAYGWLRAFSGTTTA
jgi:membrane protease YdiL (CAAX protease family)